MKPCIIVMFDHAIYEGNIIHEYQNHIIMWDHEYGYLELLIDEILEVEFIDV